MTTAIRHIRVGQVWRIREGKNVRVFERDDSKKPYVWQCQITERFFISVDEHGFQVSASKEAPGDLIELIEDAPLPIEFADSDMPEVEEPDADKLASETLLALGWYFNGQCWLQGRADSDLTPQAVKKAHPLYPVFIAAIEQAMFGKGERHGGALTPFLEQPWAHYARMHGRGFLTGQAAKKLEEAASTREGQPFDTEVLGAIVYCGMAVLKNRGVV